jgi:hypothetical protein
MLSEDLRYLSMGCIIVSDEVLEIIGQTFAINDGYLHVATVRGFDDESINYVVLQNVLKQLEPDTNS